MRFEPTRGFAHCGLGWAFLDRVKQRIRHYLVAGVQGQEQAPFRLLRESPAATAALGSHDSPSHDTSAFRLAETIPGAVAIGPMFKVVALGGLLIGLAFPYAVR